MRSSRAALAGLSAACLTFGAICLARRSQRGRRTLSMMALVGRGGARITLRAPRIFLTAGEQRQHLRHDLEMETADDVMRTLGNMKGVLMKLGQMVSYADSSISPVFRESLSRLQDSAPPMAAGLVAQVIESEFGMRPEVLFSEWDERPIAAASIGQVHRAITRDGRAVAVKVQYPDVATTMRADLDNIALLRRVMNRAFPGLDVTSVIDELRSRLTEELDYRAEAENQSRFARHFAGHPTIRIPAVVAELSTARVLTSDLVVGARFAEVTGWSQAERDAAAETIFRFAFEGIYQFRGFNGDPHPGNYLFHGNGQVSFLDYGLVKYFEAHDIEPLLACVRHMVVAHDPEGFRRSMEEAGFLAAGAPVSTEAVVDSFASFYGAVLGEQPKRITPEYASALAHRFFDAGNPLAPYVTVPRPYVILQRINIGLFAVIGELHAEADWRAISDEIWPFSNDPPTTDIGRAELAWRASAAKLRPRAASPAAS